MHENARLVMWPSPRRRKPQDAPPFSNSSGIHCTTCIDLTFLLNSPTRGSVLAFLLLVRHASPSFYGDPKPPLCPPKPPRRKACPFPFPLNPHRSLNTRDRPIL